MLAVRQPARPVRDIETADLNVPEPGLYRTKLVKDGPWVPVSITRMCACTVNGTSWNVEHTWQPTCDRFPHVLRCEVDGRVDDIWRYWPHVARQRLSQDDYDLLAETIAYERAHVAGSPYDNPRRPVDLARSASLI
ncbi:hypothetical protein [Thalassobaculum sp.]|uniref:hypothetical protein n=1 Tax=Thalassobaculum sp. TaxID=2022740 RepID=UPI0032EE4F68